MLWLSHPQPPAPALLPQLQHSGSRRKHRAEDCRGGPSNISSLTKCNVSPPPVCVEVRGERKRIKADGGRSKPPHRPSKEMLSAALKGYFGYFFVLKRSGKRYSSVVRESCFWRTADQWSNMWNNTWPVCCITKNSSVDAFIACFCFKYRL